MLGCIVGNTDGMTVGCVVGSVVGTKSHYQIRNTVVSKGLVDYHNIKLNNNKSYYYKLLETLE